MRIASFLSWMRIGDPPCACRAMGLWARKHGCDTRLVKAEVTSKHNVHLRRVGRL